MKPLLSATSIIVALPHLAKAVSEDGRRIIYFEASRDGVVDREGEMVAADALWASRELMLDQGDIDINHWGRLASPVTGRPQPEYRIGHPVDIRRSADKKAIYVKAEIYKATHAPPEGSSASWAERWWHSQVGQTPAAKWFPSVYGTILPGGIEVVKVKGQDVRRIVKVDWYSVGLAMRAQHPDLPPVSLQPIGTFARGQEGVLAKATQAQLAQDCTEQGVLYMSYATFAKSVGEGGIATVGAPQTDSALKTGVQALTPESLEGKSKQAAAPGEMDPHAARIAVLKKVRDGTVPATLAGLTKAFQACGHGASHARALLSDLSRKGRA